MEKNIKKILSDFQSIADELLADEEKNPVVPYIPREQLFNKIDLSLGDQALEDAVFLEKLTDIALSSTRSATNGFFNQLYGGRNDKAVLGELLSVLLNNSMYTYKAAGIQVGIEKILLKKSCEIIGWGENSGGTFPAGGSMSNLMAMILARNSYNDQTRLEGIYEKMTIYTSKESHYSIPKNASFIGVGRNNVRFIPTNEVGEMNVSELKKTIKKDIEGGFHPIMVNATAGTTVLGAFDDVENIYKVCKQYGIWLHVDGSYCGGVIFSEKYKHLIKGVENADSFCFNAHKMMGTPVTCSLILVKEKKKLYQSFADEADYLFQTEDDEFNPGQTSLQCGRRNDALKFWALWKSAGKNGLAKLVNHEFELADIAREYIRNHTDYQLLSFDNSISVCFNYKNIPAKRLTTELYKKAELMVSYGSFQNRDFIRFVTINAQNNKEDILLFFKRLEDFVEKHKEILTSDLSSLN